MPVTDSIKPHDRDEMLARRRDGRKPKPLPGQEELERAAAKHADRLSAEMDALRARVPVTVFIAAKRAAVDGIEARVRELLDAHPAPKTAPDEGSIDDKVEADWRELAHASRQLRPLLTALELANASESGFETYKEGFDLRLTHAMDDVGRLCSFLRLHTIRQTKAARKERPNARSRFTEFIDSLPHASPETIKAALLAEARSGNGGWQFELSGDKLSIISTYKPERQVKSTDKPKRPPQLKISGIPAAVSKARQK
jgi:hypothetical protein